MVSMTTRGWSSTPFRRWPGDRKSTRLNSSHANISYAVFCLKKKKQPHGVEDADAAYGVFARISFRELWFGVCCRHRLARLVFVWYAVLSCEKLVSWRISTLF